MLKGEPRLPPFPGRGLIKEQCCRQKWVSLPVTCSAFTQSFKSLVTKKKRLVVLFSHWLLHAYGIVSISRLDRLEQDLPLLALVPGPTLFYIATAKFTEPSRILSEGGSGH